MTDLDEILAAMVRDIDGATAAAVGGVDGLIVEQYPPDGPDLAGATAELTTVVTSVQSLFGDHLDAGEAGEVILAGDALTAYVRLLNDEYFSLVLLTDSTELAAARSISDDAGRRILEAIA
jgi:predicted regulator of Ras-like GTPase activity (Roadblock/LC7/MglB family)